MEFSRIKVTKDDSGEIATVTLNRPERMNAWEDGTTPEVAAAFNQLSDDADVRVIVLTGAGRAFCAGADLKNPNTHRLGNDGLTERIMQYNSQGAQPAFDALRRCPKPIIAAVNGYSLGVGFLIVLAADIIIASERAMFGLPQVGLGVFPAYGGPKALMRFMSKAVASEMILMSRKMSAEEAYRTGLANKVVPHESLMAEVDIYAQEFRRLPVTSVKLAKESINESADISSLAQAAKADLMRTSLLQMSNEARSRHNAWRTERGIPTKP